MSIRGANTSAIWTAIGLVIGLSSSPARGTTINVPSQEPTIQAAIHSSAVGDTVLVQPGVYVENVNFAGLDIVVGSLYLTTGDTGVIAQTIIDGNALGSVVTFLLGETSDAALVGFTIRNGLAVRGGGIHCSSASPTIAHNLIVDNQFDARDSVGYGAGIYCRDSHATIVNNVIRDNSYLGFSHNYAGGIFSESCDLDVRDNTIAYNSSQNVGGGLCLLNSTGVIGGNTFLGNSSRYGGAISCGMYSAPTICFNVMYQNEAVGMGDGMDIWDGSSPLVINNTIVNNGDMGIWWDLATPTVVNCIVWGNDVSGNVAADVLYCDIEGGFAGGIDIMEQEPLFRNPAAGDFHLMSVACGDSVDSPCIDAGHPDYIDLYVGCQQGLGTSRSDMGAYGGNIEPATDITDANQTLPGRLILRQNYPNPFNPSTTIEYVLPVRATVRLQVFDALGRLVRTICDESRPAGVNSFVWDGTDQGGRTVASGAYLYQIRVGDRKHSRKMLLLR
ncbi:MAG: right-handed parallel beta-helix repeat-containing protein [candidate division Zixibacteria bacterium]|nr:right-handed parallel beta-helix repeat-containing protein [candidate division Zixibacteria bacterium]